MAGPGGKAEETKGIQPNAFDFSPMTSLLNDPSTKEMAQQIAKDPAFKASAHELQILYSVSSFESDEVPECDTNDFYIQAMRQVMQNPQFMSMAESLGCALMHDPAMSGMLSSLTNPAHQKQMEARMAHARGDPALKPVVDEIESEGPAAMMKYWNNPAVVGRLGRAMGIHVPWGDPEDAPPADPEAESGAGEGEEDELKPTIHLAASTDDEELLRDLLADGADKDEKDTEGRTALHFACAFAAANCAGILVEAGADVDALDDNNNTPLHYAAGYGQELCVELLLQNGAAMTLQNQDKKTATHLAKLNNEMDVLALLEEHALL